MSRLTIKTEHGQLISGVGTYLVNNRIESIIAKLSHYEDLEEAGRLIEVVRCKDCDHYDTYGCGEGAGWCEVNEVGRFDNGYCHLAKLKELEGDNK